MTMSDNEFHKTRMGQKFYEKTIPGLAEEIAKLNEAVRALAESTASLRSYKPEPKKAEGDEDRTRVKDSSPSA